MKLIELKKLREKKNITQQELADECGVVRQTISNIEIGLTKPSVALAKKMGKVLEVDWTIFFSD